jgi:hypothetical protein
VWLELTLGQSKCNNAAFLLANEQGEFFHIQPGLIGAFNPDARIPKVHSTRSRKEFPKSGFEPGIAGFFTGHLTRVSGPKQKQ